jgi:hypothetical protein
LTKVVKSDEPEQKEEKTDAPVEAEVVRYKKLEVLKKGNKTSFPRKGDMGKTSDFVKTSDLSIERLISR